jgi:hypothetical protein
MAQDVATTAPPHVESMPHGTLGDYTGPVGGIMAVLLALDRFGLLRLGGRRPIVVQQIAPEWGRVLNN